MKRYTLIFAIAILFIFAFNALAGDSASVTTTATIVEAISVTKSQDLEFGTLLASGSSGTVAVAAATGSGSYSNVTAVGTTNPHQAICSVEGQPNTAYDITLPTEAVTIDDGSGHEMTVNTFTSTSTSGNTTLDGSGDDTIQIGATLSVGANQVAGEYSGTFSVTVAYQ